MEINHLAVVAAALSDLLVGGLWFSPILFLTPGKNANGFSDDQLKRQNPAKVFSLTVLFSLIISYNLAFFLAEESTDIMWGTTAGLLAGIWAAAAFAIIGLFEMKTLKYFLVNIGYILVAFTLKGFILGLWR